MIEKQPQILLSRQACLNAAISGPSSEHMIAGFMSIDSPCSEYSGKTTRSIVAMLRRALPTIATILCGLRREIRGRDDDRQLQLHDADHDAVRRFVEAAKPAHDRCSIEHSARSAHRSPALGASSLRDANSPGMSRAECLALDVAIMMPSVRM